MKIKDILEKNLQSLKTRFLYSAQVEVLVTAEAEKPQNYIIGMILSLLN